MEPANILFIIAFIGLPLAFGIWAIASRRELSRRRSASRPAPDTGEQRPRPRRKWRQPPEEAKEQPTRQQPAARPAPPQPATPDPPTVQLPTVREGPPILNLPPASPPPVKPEPEPEEERWSGSSGTTEELPIIGYPERPEDVQPTEQTAAMPAQNRQLPARLEPPLRPFYPPRYVGRSMGVVKRLTPLEAQQFVRRK